MMALVCGISLESGEAVNEVGAVYGVSTDADNRALTNAHTPNLVHRFIGQGSGAGNDTHGAGRMNVARLNADLALAGSDDPRAIGSDKPAGAALEVIFDLQHIHDRNTLGNGHDQGNAGLDGFENGIRTEWRRHENHGGVGAGFLYGFGYRVEDRNAFNVLAAFAGGHTCHHVRPVSLARQRVKLAFSYR